MDNSINALDVSEPEPIWLTVARLSAGFHRMAQLGQELVELDGIRQDNARTHAMIRRDVAAAVLQNAIALKKIQKESAYVEAAAVEEPARDQTPPQSDEWAGRLVRWADQLGRDVFKLPSLLLTSKKHGDDKSDSSKPN
jgi:hypothetical protein